MCRKHFYALVESVFHFCNCVQNLLVSSELNQPSNRCVEHSANKHHFHAYANFPHISYQSTSNSHFYIKVTISAHKIKFHNDANIPNISYTTISLSQYNSIYKLPFHIQDLIPLWATILHTSYRSVSHCKVLSPVEYWRIKNFL